MSRTMMICPHLHNLKCILKAQNTAMEKLENNEKLEKVSG
jgi:hypothetical protein